MRALGHDKCPAGKEAHVVCSGEQWKGLGRGLKNSFLEEKYGLKIQRAYVESGSVF